MVLTRNGEFVKPNGDTYIPIMVSSVKTNWIFGGDLCYHTAKRAGGLALVRDHYNTKLKKYLDAAWGPDALYVHLSSPIVSSQLGLPTFGQLTESMIRKDRLTTPVAYDDMLEAASGLYEAHPGIIGWNIVEPAWEAIFAGNSPSFVAEQILTICRAYREAAPNLPILWSECGSYSKSRGFTPATFGRVLEAVIKSGFGPELLGANSYPTHPEEWGGPDWWPLVHGPDGKPIEGAPILGISETGWQPNGTIGASWDQDRADRLGVTFPTKADLKQYSPVPGVNQPTAYKECLDRWVAFNKRAIGEFGAKFIAWHSACGHRQSSGGYIPWGPMDPLSGYWHPPEEVRAAVEESRGS